MLRSIYIDNYKSLVNFDLELGRSHLLLGRNGSGKSAMFTALSSLRSFLLADPGSFLGFAQSTCTRWERRTRQAFEFVVDLGGDPLTYRYRLEVETSQSFRRVTGESLVLAGHPLFRRDEDTVRLFSGDGTVLPGEFLVDPIVSALPRLTGRHGNEQIEAFRGWLGRVRIVGLTPSTLTSLSPEETPKLRPDLSNFASWYRHLAQEQPGNMRALEDDLRHLLGPEFQNLRLVRTGDERLRELRTEWRVDAARADSKFELDFEELSDGQRALICLYTLLHADAGEPMLLCVDEPDNYVALNEIQPWLSALSERPNIQSLLISHHPEIINLGAEDALYFYRRGQGPTRVKKFKELVHAEETLTAAELVARGWIDADS